MLRCGQNEIRMRSAHGSYMKYSVNLVSISSSLWADPDQNTVCPWQLYTSPTIKKRGNTYGFFLKSGIDASGFSRSYEIMLY